MSSGKREAGMQYAELDKLAPLVADTFEPITWNAMTDPQRLAAVVSRLERTITSKEFWVDRHYRHLEQSAKHDCGVRHE